MRYNQYSILGRVLEDNLNFGKQDEKDTKQGIEEGKQGNDDSKQDIDDDKSVLIEKIQTTPFLY